MKLLNKIYWIAIGYVLTPTSSVFAITCQPGQPCSATIQNPLGANNTITQFISLILDTVFPIAAIACVFFLIYAGFLMVVHGGNEEKLAEARRACLWAGIGVAVILGAKVLSAVICGSINQLSSTHLSCPTS